MEFDMAKASRKLCELDLKFNYEGMEVNVLWFRQMAISGDWNIARHMHSSYEFHFIKEGSCEVITDSGRFVVNAGEFYLTAPMVFHEQRSTNAACLVEYSLNCDLIPTNEASVEMSNIMAILYTAPCISYRAVPGSLEAFENALKEAYYGELGYYTSVKSYIPLIIVNAARSLPQKKSISYEIPRKENTNNFRMSQIERFIEDNISTSITTSAIAVYMHMSQKQVCRIIKQFKGMSTKEYVNSKKLIAAKELLKNSTDNIKQISEKLGFSSEFYFSQFFKNMEGYSPAFYRDNLHSG